MVRQRPNHLAIGKRQAGCRARGGMADDLVSRCGGLRYLFFRIGVAPVFRMLPKPRAREGVDGRCGIDVGPCGTRSFRAQTGSKS